MAAAFSHPLSYSLPRFYSFHSSRGTIAWVTACPRSWKWIYHWLVCAQPTLFVPPKAPILLLIRLLCHPIVCLCVCLRPIHYTKRTPSTFTHHCSGHYVHFATAQKLFLVVILSSLKSVYFCLKACVCVHRCPALLELCNQLKSSHACLCSFSGPMFLSHPSGTPQDGNVDARGVDLDWRLKINLNDTQHAQPSF